jgi:hypothetical protein
MEFKNRSESRASSSRVIPLARELPPLIKHLIQVPIDARWRSNSFKSHCQRNNYGGLVKLPATILFIYIHSLWIMNHRDTLYGVSLTCPPKAGTVAYKVAIQFLQICIAVLAILLASYCRMDFREASTHIADNVFGQPANALIA